MNDKREVKKEKLPDAPYVVEGGNGAIYSGATALEVVTAMRSGLGGNSVDLNGFMRQLAANAEAMEDNVKVRVDTPEHFLTDLAKANSIVLHRDGSTVRGGARTEQED